MINKQQLENEISEVFKPFISYSKITNNDNNFYTFYPYSNEIQYYYTIKNTQEKTCLLIMTAESNKALHKKIMAIKQYLNEVELKRIEV